MPPKKRQPWCKPRPQPRISDTEMQEDALDESDALSSADTRMVSVPPAPKLSAHERRQLFARLLWLEDYMLVFAAEAATNRDLLQSLTLTYTSVHTRRLMQRDTSEGLHAAQAVERRLTDCIGSLERSRNFKHVPISQAAKAIAFLCSGVAKPVWEAERKARRVVGREYAIQLLNEMAICRPPPPFEEQERTIICSIGFDQTYAKAGAGTGASKYNGIQTVDANGEASNVERMVYINGILYLEGDIKKFSKLI